MRRVTFAKSESCHLAFNSQFSIDRASMTDVAVQGLDATGVELAKSTLHLESRPCRHFFSQETKNAKTGMCARAARTLTLLVRLSRRFTARSVSLGTQAPRIEYHISSQSIPNSDFTAPRRTGHAHTWLALAWRHPTASQP